MKMMKKVTSLLLATILIFATFAVSGVGVSAAKYSGSYGGVNWEFDDSTNTMTFSGDGQVDAKAVSSYANRTENIVLKAEVSFSGLSTEGFPQLKSIFADESHESYSSVDGVLFNKEMKTICIYPSKKPGSSYTIPDGVVNIDDGAFLNCTELTDIKIPDSVREVGISYTFENSGCYNDPSNWDNNVLYIDNCIVAVTYSRNPISGFYNIRPGTRMILSNGIITNYGDDTVSLNKLTGLSIPDSVTFIYANRSICDYSDFLKDPKYLYAGAYYLDNWLLATNEHFSGHLKIKEGTRYIWEGALSNCNNATAITIPGSVKSIPQLRSIGFGTVNKTTTEIFINEGVEIIEDYAFYDFAELKKVSFPKSLKKIYTDSCFTSVDLNSDDGPSVSYSMTSITFSYAGTMDEWKDIEIICPHDEYTYYTDFCEQPIHCSDGIINEREPVPAPTYDEQNNMPIPPIFILIAIVVLVIFIFTIIKLRVKKKKEKESSKEYKTLS